MAETYDAIVIGGGPGGATASTMLAMRGKRVLLLERDRFPRHRIGESLLPATIHGICTLLGLGDEIHKQGFQYKRGGAFRWGKDQAFWGFSFQDLKLLDDASAGFAYQVERSKFDTLLLNNARKHGVDAREGHSVTELLVEGDRATGVRFTDDQGRSHTASAQFVIDASGSSSKVSSWVGERVYSKFFQNIALYGYYTGGKRLPSPAEGNILCAAFPEGWFWYIPLNEDLTSVGAVIDKRNSDLLKTDYEAAMNRFIDMCPLIKEYLAPAKRVTEGDYGIFRVVKDYSYTSTRFWRNGACLVGDSACFVDPVLSTGVHLATYSGMLAARSILTTMSGTIPEQRCFDEFEKRYKIEYERIYNFMQSFYDMEQDLEGYYWSARRLKNTEEKSNEAFISIVAGVSSGEYFGARLGQGQTLAQHIKDIDLASAHEKGTSPSMGGAAAKIVSSERVKQAVVAEAQGRPVFEGGLVATADGFGWVEGEASSFAKEPVARLIRM